MKRGGQSRRAEARAVVKASEVVLVGVEAIMMEKGG